MSFVHGKETRVYLGAVDLSPYLNSADLAADVDTADTTTFAASWKTAIAGVVSAKVDVGGFYDPAEASLPALIASLVPGVLTVCPGGAAAIGDRARLLSAFDTQYAESSPVGGVVGIKAAFLADGVVGVGDVLHPLAEDTNTTTGASKDDAAATTTGWTAHLHVTAVDAGSWVIKIEDSANGSAWADLTGGTFTAATAGTSQRLTGAAGATLRRYVRYTATRTGGAGGDGVSFVLAYSRN